MAIYEDRESFIPYSKADIIELCIEDGKFNKEEQKKFREFCEIVSAYYHFDFHKILENLKKNFIPYAPDLDTKVRIHPTENQLLVMEKNLIHDLKTILEKANYSPLTELELNKALNGQSLIELQLQINFDDFDNWALYHRGNTQETANIKKLFGFKTVSYSMDIYERVVLLVKFKNEEYFLNKFKGNKKKLEALNFKPGKMYLYLYENIPQSDLEIVFPNVEMSMNKKDKLFLGIPALGAGIPVLLKLITQVPTIISNLPFILAAISAFFTTRAIQDPGNIMPMLSAMLTLLITVGSFIFRQYVKVKNKKIKFLKEVTDILFFKNLVSNSGVFNFLVDAAEEEECKEVILSFYHLFTAEQPLSIEELDDKIENWLEEKFNTKIDFNVEKALYKLKNLRGKVIPENAQDSDIAEQSILKFDENLKCKIVSLDDAKIIIDYIWDNIYQYN